jgi:hypothetical protein
MPQEPQLVGWDDGKVYFYLEGKEYCVSEEAGLLQQIMVLCEQYFERKCEGQVEPGEP